MSRSMRPWFRDRFLRSGSHLGDMLPPNSYHNWTREELIERLTALDRRDARSQSSGDHQTKASKQKLFNFSAHPTRKIALKFCYSGWAYNGLAFQISPTPLPTVEETIFKALAKLKLVDYDAGPEGCGWERCGRTDRGVSAAGQVISLWVRSAQSGHAGRPTLEGNDVRTPSPKPSFFVQQFDDDGAIQEGDIAPSAELALAGPSSAVPSPTPEKPELRYVSLLNRVLPPTIRVYAWSPIAPDFSARFACRWRHYKYFFSLRDLDLDRMRDGAARLVGDHDFRNVCKVDPSKQITNFTRTIKRADISAVPDEQDDMYVFDLVGSGFLYHQVRHIMAILFLVGTGLEKPSVVSALLNTDPALPTTTTDEEGLPLDLVDRKPEYQMADGLPLMLWDCGYDDSDVQWRTDGAEPGVKDAALLPGSGAELYQQLLSTHTHSRIHATLESHFLSAVARHHTPSPPLFPLSHTGLAASTRDNSGVVMQIPLGAGTFHRTAKYVPLLSRRRQDNVAMINERWLNKKSNKLADGADAVDHHTAGRPDEGDE
ncbi:hypothetical protein PLICRDRAFT_368528 [Plicaturopsis crispa FD-325 SS-3]|uniref:Pseudouridine synthase I TruA alpha/beta domain-containing protein n=1 Tax=Plicaturopsis crispa FD-325 SS-3 TaxID=944288 RepID=A0A0C9T7C5_PLICR|nr:hypothetical protein PLICRDRAFT_368528 [Plicaturopsis crispa FD-325 SS-3]